MNVFTSFTYSVVLVKPSKSLTVWSYCIFLVPSSLTVVIMVQSQRFLLP
ncbi:MAG: hypothetical protein IKN41_09225 [Candidatus Methanomethylophilaceae archaeon]|nr:hypothetical protein [Candidatus Methanomethylophilaceae archaeon]